MTSPATQFANGLASGAGAYLGAKYVGPTVENAARKTAEVVHPSLVASLGGTAASLVLGATGVLSAPATATAGIACAVGIPIINAVKDEEKCTLQ